MKTIIERRRQLKMWMAFRAYASLSWCARIPPEPIARRGFVWGGRVAHATFTQARRRVTDNYAHVLGAAHDSAEVRAAVRQGFDRYARFWLESFRMVDEPEEHFLGRMQVDGQEDLDRALADGKGVILVMAHSGNWDAAAHWVGLMGYEVLAVVEELKPKKLLDLFLDHRAALGIPTLPASRGGEVGGRLRKHLHAGGVAALVADRTLSGRGVTVEMFGAERMMPAGPAALALSTGAPLMPCCAQQVPGGWRGRIFPPIEVPSEGNSRSDVAALTRALASRLEAIIAADPTDWHMFQSAWPS